MHKISILCAYAVLLTSSIGAAGADESAPSSFLGNWSSSCDAWGVPAHCSSNWSHGLHDTHLVQEYKIVRADNGAPIFSGRGVYKLEGSAVRGAWEGSNGAIHEIIGVMEENAISVVWGAPESEIGRSDYSIIEGELVVSDFVLTPTGWRKFMSIQYASKAE